MQRCDFDLKFCQPILTATGMQGLDNSAKSENIEKGFALMQQAAEALFHKAVSLLDDEKKSVAIFVGGGNNGGDGIACAELFFKNGIPCTVYSLVEPQKFRNEAKMAYDSFIIEGGKLILVQNEEEPIAEKTLKSYDLIIDAMLGIGATGELRPLFASVVKAINRSNVKVLAADVPTGFNNKEHKPYPICIKAAETLMFGLPRMDGYFKDGATVFGKVSVAPLPYDSALIRDCDREIYLAEKSLIGSMLPHRDEWGDKRKQGAALIIAGSLNMTGAADLCTRAALRCGTGLATLAAPATIIPILQTKMSEPVFCRLEDNGNGFLQPENVALLMQKIAQSTAMAIGPGISTEPSTTQTVVDLLKNQDAIPMVIDADALNAIAKECAASGKSAIDFLRSLKAPAILSPHHREWQRLFGELPNNPEALIESLRETSKLTQKTIILKGAPTLIGIPDGKVFVAPVANSGMAKGGSGDVLTGIMVALLSQGIPSAEAAILGVLIHQEAGLIARKNFSAYSMLPSDVIDFLPKVFKSHCS